MAKFRNVLVHLYLEVDLRKVYSYLQNQLDDLERFSEHIVMYISQGTAEAEGGTLSDDPVGG